MKTSITISTTTSTTTVSPNPVIPHLWSSPSALVYRGSLNNEHNLMNTIFFKKLNFQVF